MNVWAISDLHLSFGVPDKEMDVFGPEWQGYTDRLAVAWREQIKVNDLVLVAGDISWAMRLEEAVPDLEWIHDLPGHKVILKGNHDYWWTTFSKIEKAMPESIHILHNNALLFGDFAIGGSRLWDTPEYNFGEYIIYNENPTISKAKPEPELSEEEVQRILHNQEKIYDRELHRLKLSLTAMDQDAAKRVVMTHYPPINAELADSQVSRLLEAHNIDTCVFGHLHRVRRDKKMFGIKNNVKYVLTSCDYLDFVPTPVF